MSRKSGVVRSTSAGMADSSVTSPTTSISGWSAKVVRISSRISRGQIATRTRMDLFMLVPSQRIMRKGNKRQKYQKDTGKGIYAPYQPEYQWHGYTNQS